MSNTTEVRWAGPFTDGEIPLPFTVKFDPSDIDFTGFTLNATLEEQDGTELTFSGTVDWDAGDGETVGRVRVDLAAADVAKATSSEIETKRMQIWAGDGGTNLVATLKIKFIVNAAVGTVPAI